MLACAEVTTFVACTFLQTPALVRDERFCHSGHLIPACAQLSWPHSRCCADSWSDAPLQGMKMAETPFPGLIRQLWTAGPRQAAEGWTVSLSLTLLGDWGLCMCWWPSGVSQDTLILGSSSFAVNAPLE